MKKLIFSAIMVLTLAVSGGAFATNCGKPDCNANTVSTSQNRTSTTVKSKADLDVKSTTSSVGQTDHSTESLKIGNAQTNTYAGSNQWGIAGGAGGANVGGGALFGGNIDNSLNDDGSGGTFGSGALFGSVAVNSFSTQGSGGGSEAWGNGAGGGSGYGSASNVNRATFTGTNNYNRTTDRTSFDRNTFRPIQGSPGMP